MAARRARGAGRPCAPRAAQAARARALRRRAGDRVGLRHAPDRARLPPEPAQADPHRLTGTMPEGDTIHSAARRMGAALVGRPIESIETPQPRHARDRWPERLGGRAVRAVDARGKHLFLRFEGDLTLHSHLRMGGWWGVFRQGERWRRSPRRAWLVIRTPDHEVVQFDGPVLELMTEGRTRFDQRLAGLGPDILAEELDEAAALRNLRGDDATRGVGDVLLDQGNVAGIGNIWKAESC